MKLVNTIGAFIASGVLLTGSSDALKLNQKSLMKKVPGFDLKMKRDLLCDTISIKFHTLDEMDDAPVLSPARKK